MTYSVQVSRAWPDMRFNLPMQTDPMNQRLLVLHHIAVTVPEIVAHHKARMEQMLKDAGG